VEAHPQVALGSWALIGTLLLVSGLNFVAAVDNYRLLALEQATQRAVLDVRPLVQTLPDRICLNMRHVLSTGRFTLGDAARRVCGSTAAAAVTRFTPLT
jgi:hypothetical protein